MPVNDTTTNRSYQKPNIANTLSDDVGRLRSALDAIDTDMASKAPTAGPTFTGVVAIAGGSAAAPSLAFTGDTNTGLYSPGTDQVAISTGGTGRLFVDASGRLGLGTSSPSTLLHLSAATGSATPTTAELRIETTTQASDWSTTSPWGRIGFYSADTSGGGAKTHIAFDATSVIATGSVSNLSIKFPDGATADLVERFKLTYDGSLTISANTGRAPSIWNIAGSEVARIDPSGRLLLGTSSVITNDSNSVIQAAGASRADVVLGSALTTGIVAGNNIGLFRCFGNVGGTYQECGRISVIADGTHALNDKPSALTFSVTPPGASTVSERVRIVSTGSVGIGTATPAATLHVAGPARIGANSTNDAQLEIGAGATGNRYAYIDFVGDTTYTDYGFRIIRNNTGANANTVLRHRGTGLLSLAADEAASITFHTTATERVRVDSSGRLLVGTSADIAGGLVQFGQNTGTVATAVQTIGSNAGAAYWVARSNAGTIVASGDTVGTLDFRGYDGAAYLSLGLVRGEVDGTPGTNDMPGRIVLSTTLDGASSPTEQWRISNAGTVIYNQPAPAAVDVTATLTVANLTAKIITSSTAAAVTMTLPTGTNMDAGFNGLYTNMAFEWTVINTGGTNAVTVAANTAHTIVGSGTVAANGSARFLSRRTAVTTWVTYRLAA